MTRQKQASRGPLRLERVPPQFANYEGVEGISTLGQLRQFKQYLDTPRRPPFVRLGASTPQSVAILLRQVLKKMDPGTIKKFKAPKDVSAASAAELLDFYERIVVDSKALTQDSRRAASAMTNARRAERLRKKPYSVWAVEVGGVVKVVRRDDEDPRVAYRWMKAGQRPWNIDKATES